MVDTKCDVLAQASLGVKPSGATFALMMGLEEKRLKNVLLLKHRTNNMLRVTSYGFKRATRNSQHT